MAGQFLEHNLNFYLPTGKKWKHSDIYKKKKSACKDSYLANLPKNVFIYVTEKKS